MLCDSNLLPVTRDEWIEAFARELGVAPPTPAEAEKLLALAGTAAHSTERTAAPLACWVAGRAGASIEAFLAAAERVNAR
jgi:hypothetical protein